jgi:FkbM family methyltransferase
MFKHNYFIAFAVIICIYLLWTAEHVSGPKDKLKRIWRNRVEWQKEKKLRSTSNTTRVETSNTTRVETSNTTRVESEENETKSQDAPQDAPTHLHETNRIESEQTDVARETNKQLQKIDVSCNNERPPEIHAFVLWNPSLWESQLKIIRDSELEIVDTFEVEKDHYKWCLNIYGSESNVKHHGNCKKYGNPKVVVVKDKTPIYGEKKTIGARQILNQNIYGMKTLLRKQTSLGYMAVHSSNNVEEAYLILEPLSRHYGVQPEFETIEDVFNVLNKYPCLRYVVQRSHHEVSSASISKDIDILVSDYFMFKSLTGARSRYPKTMREVDNGPNIQNIVADRWTFDVRYIGDGHYDTKWQQDMLQRRIPHDFFFIQEPISYAFSLIYYYNVHKPYRKCRKEHIHIVKNVQPLLSDVHSLRAKTGLRTYMNAHNYTVSKPHDTTVGYYKFSSLYSAELSDYHHHNCKYITAQTEFGKVILKQEPTQWNTKCGKKEVFPQFCDRPVGDIATYEASMLLGIEHVPLTIGKFLHDHDFLNVLSQCPAMKKRYHNRGVSFHSVQIMEDSIVSYNPQHKNAADFVRVGILDFLMDNCDRFGYYPRWDNVQLLSKSYNKHNWAKKGADFFIFDNAKALSCLGMTQYTKEDSRRQFDFFWENWQIDESNTLPPIAGRLGTYLKEVVPYIRKFVSEKSLQAVDYRSEIFMAHGHSNVKKTTHTGATCIIEIKKGSMEKNEINSNQEARQLKTPIPANYGFIQNTLVDTRSIWHGYPGDGDPLDCVVLGHSLQIGQAVDCRPVGVIEFVDNEQMDWKIICDNPETPTQGGSSFKWLSSWLLDYKSNPKYLKDGQKNAQYRDAQVAWQIINETKQNAPITRGMVDIKKGYFQALSYPRPLFLPDRASTSFDFVMKSEKTNLRIMQDIFKKCNEQSIFIDSGANEGMWSQLSAASGCKTISVEPQKLCIQWITKSSIINDVRLDVYQNFLTDRETFTVDVPTNKCNGAAAYRKDKGYIGADNNLLRISGEKEKVHGLYLPSLFDENSTILMWHLDVEGAELNVLKSSQTLFDNKQIKNIIIEWAPRRWHNFGWSKKDGMNFIRNLFNGWQCFQTRIRPATPTFSSRILENEWQKLTGGDVFCSQTPLNDKIIY